MKMLRANNDVRIRNAYIVRVYNRLSALKQLIMAKTGAI